MSKQVDSSKPAEEKKKKPKLGAGHVMAMVRQGFKEIQSATYTGSNIAREPEVGMFGNPTQGERADERDPDKTKQKQSRVDSHAADARAEAQTESQRRGPSRD